MRFFNEFFKDTRIYLSEKYVPPIRKKKKSKSSPKAHKYFKNWLVISPTLMRCRQLLCLFLLHFLLCALCSYKLFLVRSHQLSFTYPRAPWSSLMRFHQLLLALLSSHALTVVRSHQLSCALINSHALLSILMSSPSSTLVRSHQLLCALINSHALSSLNFYALESTLIPSLTSNAMRSHLTLIRISTLVNFSDLCAHEEYSSRLVISRSYLIGFSSYNADVWTLRVGTYNFSRFLFVVCLFIFFFLVSLFLFSFTFFHLLI